MRPSPVESLRCISLAADLEALFERAKEARCYGLAVLPEEEVANALVELLAPVVVRMDDVLRDICRATAARRQSCTDLDRWARTAPTEAIHTMLGDRL